MWPGPCDNLPRGYDKVQNKGDHELQLGTRLMTFNIRGAVHNDGENVWPNRAGLNVQTIRRCDPDVIGFQELHRANLAVYKEQLPEYEYFLGLHSGNADPYEYNSIFWKPSRFELVDSGGFWLSTTPDRYSRSWNTQCIRCANWVRLRGVADGVEFLHLNTHLDHISEEARVNGSTLILQKLREMVSERQPVVVTGDFNCTPGTPSYQAFMEAGFTDVYIATGNEDTEDADTFHGFRGSEFGKVRIGPGPIRIDYILTKGAEAKSCVVVRDAEPPLYPSDHYPVLAELTMDS